MYLLYKLGAHASSNAKFHSDLWDITEVYCEDVISDSGKDWNFEQHKQNSLVPKDSDYITTIGSHMAWEASNYIQECPTSVLLFVRMVFA